MVDLALAPRPLPLAPFWSWTILLAPLGAAALIWGLGIRRRGLSAALAIGGLLASFVCAVRVFLVVVGQHRAPAEVSWPWISIPGLHVSFGLLLDPLSLLMTLVVTGVGSAIFIYSTGYMAEDHAYSRYFGLLSLFAFSMLAIVLAPNWIQLFMGWELVGFASYALIGHWYAKSSAAEAGKKAFVVNRVADVGFFLGILALWAFSGAGTGGRTFDLLAQERQLPALVQAGLVPTGILALIGLLIFCGPIGKSAQFPLHVWLPDAMEGPTPVSALIHAATMVAAGVYLLARTFWLFALLPSVLQVIAWVGGATAFLTACLALVEHDLKRILAYSTLSQLGYMVMAMGLAGPVAGMHHLTTHAFFKALLFLAAGSVIHGTHEQDIRRLGGLWRSMRATSLAFLIGGLALSGLWPLSGFFSKDEILVLARERSLALYALGTLTAGLTAFYIARAWFVAFTGKPQARAHESGPVMLAPLALLALLSLGAGTFGIPHVLGGAHAAWHWDVVALSTGAALMGLALAWLIYSRRVVSARGLAQALAVPHTLLSRRYYLDELYDWYVARIQQRLIAGACAWVERRVIIGGMVNGLARLTASAGGLIRLCQTGKVQTYVLGFFLGVVFLLTLRGGR